MTKFLIIGDLHGAMPKFYFKPRDFDAIIAPGDFCSDAPRKYMFQSLKLWLNEKIDIEWYDLAGRRKAVKMLKKSLRDGRRVLEFLNSLNKPVFITPGNWDWTSHSGEHMRVLRRSWYKNYLIKGLKNIHDLHLKAKNWKSFRFIGHGITSGPEYPQGRDIKNYNKKELNKRKKAYIKNVKKLSKLFNEAKRKGKIIVFLTHNIPYNTKLDLINNKLSPRHGQHFGSVIAKEAIKKYKPLACIGGHMHEHFGKQKMASGRTTAINAGFGGRVNTLLEIDEDKGRIKSIRFVNKDRRREINGKVGRK